ncbi:MAG: tRNA pseudouridine(55) synthase TruB [Alphaproteobacteria bacterium]|nr:tRNA pseudouridine(55) synthase TruB [Alphaproteobacteria bacterium]MCB9696460.1 tRNA pseudouridine(55) synthase TruB [Alphaproteobacteria bacterium]
MSGFLVVDKPVGLTSHDVVAIVRSVTGLQKVGHTGTLDPFATGVLPLALGRSTRLIQYLDESIKVYDANIRLGSATDTGDPTGTVVREAPLPTADEAGVDEVLRSFLGERMQEPPAYSAVKVAGRPMYEYARKGKPVKAAARPIVLHAVERLSYDRETLRVRITCSRGTYARVLADEIATALGSAGHLQDLARERSGPFVLEDAISMSQLAAIVSGREDLEWKRVLTPGRGDDRVKWRPREEVAAGLAPRVRSELRCLSHIPMAEISAVDAKRVRQGGSLPVPPRGVGFGGRYLVVAADELIAVAENTPQGPRGLRVG